ncbi:MULTISPECIES: ubiquinol-cytochrome C chaperone family protein [unclassified Hoeflea]|jgi:cytochrome b pre-mRNA-processing protein 3|uniref:ubiquinol-cytochrome C chaperone family protein n=1 Tax=unclassified Hoeflea TaxID=2614931 RepID=UPI002AFFC197|nr:ubiquinol-cytochrome C chaperone family protein [Hoeflea sp.]
MIWSLFKRKKANQALVTQQYALITQAARSPVFYEHMGVPDTVMGRFEMIAVHLILYLRRTGTAGVAAQGIAQEIVDAFFEDIDHSIRELGIGDMGVPKRMKKLARMFYGRVKSYGQAIESGDEAVLADALGRNIHPDDADAARSMQQLSHWVMQTARALEQTDEDTLASGRLTYPPATAERESDD